MNLVELNPRWVTLEDGGPKVGLSFDCPHCRSQRLAVLFHHSGREAMENFYILARSPSTNYIWDFTGDDFSNITLTPSIDASSTGHWHGFIKNGAVT